MRRGAACTDWRKADRYRAVFFSASVWWGLSSVAGWGCSCLCLETSFQPRYSRVCTVIHVFAFITNSKILPWRVLIWQKEHLTLPVRLRPIPESWKYEKEHCASACLCHSGDQLPEGQCGRGLPCRGAYSHPVLWIVISPGAWEPALLLLLLGWKKDCRFPGKTRNREQILKSSRAEVDVVPESCATSLVQVLLGSPIQALTWGTGNSERGGEALWLLDSYPLLPFLSFHSQTVAGRASDLCCNLRKLKRREGLWRESRWLRFAGVWWDAVHYCV